MLKAGVPDNVIGPRDAPWLIVDAKYKNPMRWRRGGQYFINEDLYQAFTYAAALDAPTVLVYPRVDRDVNVTLETAGVLTRDVSADLVEGVKSRMERIARALLAEELTR